MHPAGRPYPAQARGHRTQLRKEYADCDGAHHSRSGAVWSVKQEDVGQRQGAEYPEGSNKTRWLTFDTRIVFAQLWKAIFDTAAGLPLSDLAGLADSSSREADDANATQRIDQPGQHKRISTKSHKNVRVCV